MKTAAITVGLMVGLYHVSPSRTASPDVVRPVPCVELAESISRWCDSTGVPRRIAYGVALAETGYRGPDHYEYDHRQVSSAGALGPMQVMPRTGSWISGVDRRTCERMLMDSIDFNVMCSLRYLAKLHRRRGSWPVALGEYNTGYPVVNEYARRVMAGKGW